MATTPITRYVVAAAIAGAVALGGIGIAGAQSDADATTTTEVPGETAPQAPGERPDREGCDEAKAGADSSTDSGTDAEGTSTETAPEASNTLAT